MTHRTPHPASAPVFAGIDVGAEALVLVLRRTDVTYKTRTFANTPADHLRLVNTLRKIPDITVCMEATGVYHLDIAIALHDAGIKLMVINPKAAHHFTNVLMKHSKTDSVDADTLAQYAQRMDFEPWTRPTPNALALRRFARHIQALTHQKAATKNQLHALAFTHDTPPEVLHDARVAITQLEQRIAKLTQDALTLIHAHPDLAQTFTLLVSVKGIGQASAIALMGELLLLPPHLSNKQWVKFAGLDPRTFESGKSVHKPARLSKAGNRYLRAALYLPALSAKQHDPYIRAYFQHLVDNGKKPLQAVCAVMRKLLHAIHGMLQHNQPFDSTRFFAMPVNETKKMDSVA